MAAETPIYVCILRWQTNQVMESALEMPSNGGRAYRRRQHEDDELGVDEAPSGPGDQCNSLGRWGRDKLTLLVVSAKRWSNNYQQRRSGGQRSCNGVLVLKFTVDTETNEG